MTSAEILAVIVSYNGRESTRTAVDALRDQVGKVLVVDNASDTATQSVLSELEQEGLATVIRLDENRGIGHALNVGVAEARAGNFSWLLTMDQDSVADPAMIRAYQAASTREPSLVSLTPTTVDPKDATSSPRRNGYAITSGNLVSLAIFDEIGLYDEAFFVDCVDFDFSLRLRRAGYSITSVHDAVLHHRVGERAEVPRLAQKFYTLHSPLRRYYMFRNYMYLTERYVTRFPIFIARLGLLHLLLLLLMAVYDPRPVESYRAVLRGLRDYFARVQGPAPGFSG